MIPMGSLQRERLTFSDRRLLGHEVALWRRAPGGEFQDGSPILDPIAVGQDELSWMAKKIIKYVPGVGWGMLFLDCLFLERDWASDKESIRRTFAKLRHNRIPLWFLSFPEGTRFSPEKLQASRRYARSIGRPEPRHVLLPRTKGFVATVEGLRGHVSAIYDITIGYGPEGVPTMGQYIQGLSNRCYLHVRRFPMDEVPEEPEALADWLLHRFSVKDEFLDQF